MTSLCRQKVPKVRRVSVAEEHAWLLDLCRSERSIRTHNEKTIAAATAVDASGAWGSRGSCGGENACKAHGFEKGSTASTTATAGAIAISRVTRPVVAVCKEIDAIVEMPRDGSVVWRYLLRDRPYAPTAIERALRVQTLACLIRHIEARLRQLAIVVFKIGVAADPDDRFLNQSAGTCMRVICLWMFCGGVPP